MSDKPRVLVLGGCGFIGRNFVKFLVDSNHCSYIKIADKALPATSYLSPEHKAAFESKEVKFAQADLTKDAHIEKVFNDTAPFDYVFNLCGETRFARPEDEYKTKIVESAVKGAKAALASGVKKWVEVSDGRIYASDKNKHKEDAKMAPWTNVATWRLHSEEELAKLKLPMVILRPAIVYGHGDLTGITPRIACAAVYQAKKEKMKFLWDKDLKMNVVHVDDLCEAMWVAATKLQAGSVYNVSEESDLDQGQLNEILGHIFGIETGFLGTIVSNLAKLNLKGVADQANDEHVPGWSRLCQAHNILNTPISPYIDQELLKHDHLSIDGSKIVKEGEFQYKHKISEAEVRAQIEELIKNKLFPPILN